MCPPVKFMAYSLTSSVFRSFKLSRSQALVAHTCNASYSGGRVWEDCGLKPAQANSSRDPMLKKPFTEKGIVEWLKV
jgi:hypothetical protein